MKKYKDSFLGGDACRWLVDSGISSDLPDAVQLGNEFLRNGFVTDVCGDKLFRNSGLYRFDDAAINTQLQMAQSPDSVFSDVNLSPTVQLIEDSPEMSSLDLDYDIADQLRMSSFDTDDLATTPPSTGKFGSCPRDHPVVQPQTRSMPMMIGNQSKAKRSSTIYRQHHNRGNRLGIMVTTSEPITPSIALFASTTEHTPEPLALDAQETYMQSDDGDESRDLTISLSGTATKRRKSTDFDLPDIHALEDSVSEIEYIDDSVDHPSPNHSETDSGLVFCHVYFAKDGNDSNHTK